MIGFFQKLADPFVTDDGDPLPTTAWAFLTTQFRSLRPILAASLVLTLLVASLEVWMIGYSGTLVDLLATSSPATLWSEHGTELLLAAVAIAVFRPLLALIAETLDDVAFRPNAEALLRWRAHHLDGRVAARRDVEPVRLARRVAAGPQDSSAAAAAHRRAECRAARGAPR